MTEAEVNVSTGAGNTADESVGLTGAAAVGKPIVDEGPAAPLESMYKDSEDVKPEAKTEEPKTEEPKTEEPKTEEPKTEEPKTEEPKTEDSVSYENVKMPADVPYDEGVFASVKELFKDAGLSEEQAQKLIDFDASRVRDALAGQEKKAKDDVKLLKEELGDEFSSTLHNANRALARFDTFTEDYPNGVIAATLAAHGLHTHPDFVRMLASIQKQTGEDSTVLGGDTGKAQKLTLMDLYNKEKM